jgi:death-on-curing protein
VEPITLEDLVLIGELVLGIPAETLLRTMDVGLAESALAAPFATFGGHDFYDEPAVQAAVLASRLMRNHPLVDGNKRLALVTMIEFLRRNGCNWPAALDQDEVAETFEKVAARETPEQQFAAWVRSKLDT